MADVPQELTIRSGTAIERRPTLRATAPAAGSFSSYLVRLQCDHADKHLSGWGESLPYGDGAADYSGQRWSTLVAATISLAGQTIPLRRRSDALGHARKLIDNAYRLNGLTPGYLTEMSRGLLVGIEVALLDLVSRSLNIGLADLLGRQRTRVELATQRISLTQPSDKVARAYRRRIRQQRTVRFQLVEDPDFCLRTLRNLAKDVGTQRDVRWWLDGGGVLTEATAGELTSGLAVAMRKGQLPGEVILEQPLPALSISLLAALQRTADSLTSRRFGRRLDLRIMADESLRTEADLCELFKDGGCRAIRVNYSRVDGFLAALDLVQAALTRQPDTIVVLSGCNGSSDLSARALRHLAMAFPRVDYVINPSVTDPAEITEQPLPDLSSDRKLEAPGGVGIGTGIRLETVVADSQRYHAKPTVNGPMLGHRLANIYPAERYTQALSKLALRSHLVEREAIAHGLTVTRFNSAVFIARDAGGNMVNFGRAARSPVSGACASMLADEHKGAAQAILARAGAPVPLGRVFASDDTTGATAFARSIGYPVVTKPVAGTGGIGVTTHISNDKELTDGFEAIKAVTRYAGNEIIVQRHVPGNIYRIVVCDGEVIAAATRQPASVTGDGMRSVAELIIEKNAYRHDNPRLRYGLILAASATDHLYHSGLDPSFVPDVGERVMLGDKWYFEAGGDSVEVLEELHPTIADAAVSAVATIPEMRFCGVDILLENHQLPLGEQSAGICELNSAPQLIAVQYPLFGEPRPVARRLLTAAARRRGVALSDPVDHATLRTEVVGRRLGPDYVAWYSAFARSFAIAGWVRTVPPDRIEATIEGPIASITSLASMAVIGPTSARPIRATTRQTHQSATEPPFHQEDVTYGRAAWFGPDRASE